MHVFLIAQYYPPEVGAASTRWGDYVDILIKQGHKVTVLCEVPNYPYGKFINGYKNKFLIKEKISKNYTILRSGVIANDRKTSFKKLLNYISFSISATFNSLKVSQYDLLIISSPPLFVGLVGLFLKKIKKKNYWLDIRDLWPDSIASLVSGKKSLFYKFGKRLESLIYNSSSGIIMPVPGFKDYFDEHVETFNKPKIILKNGISRTFFEAIKKTKVITSQKFIVLYSGNFGLAQGLDSIIEVAKILKKLPIEFKLIGDGVQKNRVVELSKKNNLTNITFYDPVDQKKLISFIKKSSVCLVPLKNDPLFKAALPSKMFEYMACGRPVVCTEGEAGDLVDALSAGQVVKPENAESFSNSILNYYKNREKISEHGNNGYNYVSQNMVKEDLLNDVLKEIKTLS